MQLELGHIIALSRGEYRLTNKITSLDHSIKRRISFWDIQTCTFEAIGINRDGKEKSLFVKLAPMYNTNRQPTTSYILLAQEKWVYQALGHSDPLTPFLWDHGGVEVDGQSFYAIVREFRNGTSLQDISGLELEIFMRLMKAAIATLISYEKAGFIHGDLCPEHFLIGQDNQFTLFDPVGYPIDTHGNIINRVHGTGRWMFIPPKDVESGIVDRSRDIFAIGKILSRALTSSCLYDPIFIKIINKATHQTTDRYASMAELGKDFNQTCHLQDLIGQINVKTIY